MGAMGMVMAPMTVVAASAGAVVMAMIISMGVEMIMFMPANVSIGMSKPGQTAAEQRKTDTHHQ